MKTEVHKKSLMLFQKEFHHVIKNIDKSYDFFCLPFDRDEEPRLKASLTQL
jgi:hypothetical protein